MKITVFGAAGRTGQIVVAEALRRGHQVTAFARRPGALRQHPDVVLGDGRDPHAVRLALSGADAVIATLAARRRKGPHQTADVARVITQQMGELGIRRLAITSAYPIVGERPRLPIALLRLVLAGAYADLRAMERIVSTSQLDWTIVRLNRLTDGPARGGVRTSLGQLGRPTPLTRADAAIVLLDIVERDTASRAAINVAGVDNA